MVFRCQQCGECCSYMGDIIDIAGKTGPSMFRIRFSVTGEERIVVVDPDKENLFHTQDIRLLRPMACPFLRFDMKGRALCTIHETRPGLCRGYTCFRLLILDPEGNHIGRVQDESRFFSTMNDGLRELWDDKISGVNIPDEAAWEVYVADVFSRAGYRIVR
jgi:uncharacterized protein